MAQSVMPSQIVPRTIAPPPPQHDDSGLPAREANDPPAVAESIPVTIGDVEIRGAFPELREANETFSTRVANRTMPLGAVFDAASTLEQAYARQGYVLARVVVPPQRISADAPLCILVIDGFIEAIDLDGVPVRRRDAVDKRLRHLVNRPHLTQVGLERQLLLAGELAGVRLRSALKRGESTGGVILVVEGREERFEGRIDVNNMLPASLGGWQWNASLAANNLLGIGEQAYVVLGSQFRIDNPDFPAAPFSMIGGGITVPIRADGTSVGMDYLRARTEPKPVAGGLSSIGKFERATLRISNPLILTRRESLRFNGSVSWVRQSLHASDFNLDLSRDDYATGTMSLDWQKSYQRGALAASAGLSWGMIGREGTLMTPLSRQGAGADFARLEGRFRADRAVGHGFGLTLVGRGQSALGKPQLLGEQFSLDGREGVSAFSSGAFNADSGFTLRSEVSYTLPASIGSAVASPYLYGAKGRGWLEQATPQERGNFTAASIGAGVRAAYSRGGTAHSLNFEVGRQFTNIPGRRGDMRANLTASMSF